MTTKLAIADSKSVRYGKNINVHIIKKIGDKTSQRYVWRVESSKLIQILTLEYHSLRRDSFLD